MKNTQVNNNPTAFFLQQSTNPTPEHRDKINEFVNKLLNLRSCVLCKLDYNFTDRIPRILIHCGHTFCSTCLKNFHKNNRVRCPMCLKLVKNIETLDRLPVNHTIFSKMAEECKEAYTDEFIDSKVEPKSQKNHHYDDSHKEQENFRDFQKVSKNPGVLLNNPQNQQTHYPSTRTNNVVGGTKNQLIGQPMFSNQFEVNNYMIDPQYHNKQEDHANTLRAGYDNNGGGDDAFQEELEYCDVHTDRVKHFYCLTDKTICCRVCREILHAKGNCIVLDLYETDDIQGITEQIANDEAEKALFDGKIFDKMSRYILKIGDEDDDLIDTDEVGNSNNSV